MSNDQTLPILHQEKKKKRYPVLGMSYALLIVLLPKGLFGCLQKSSLARTSKPGSSQPGFGYATSCVRLPAASESGQVRIVFG
jgi:hypothetical protein